MDSAATLIFLAITLLTATLAVFLTTHFLARRTAITQTRVAQAGRAGPGTDMLRIYRFREEYLLSDIDPDDAFLEADVARSAAFKRLLTALSPLSPDLAPRIKSLQERGEAFLLEGHIGPDPMFIGGRLDADNVVVLSTGPSGDISGRQPVDAATLAAMQSELVGLRVALDCGTTPMWREDAKLQVTWANAAYFDLVERSRGGEAPGWPLPRIFAEQIDPPPGDGTARRCTLELPDRDEPSWFEISRDVLPGGTAMFTAQPVDQLVRTETSLREFLQTTTKIFAALPVGLAVFDRKRQLVTFNPALATLTDAGMSFLSGRPDLTSFLDRLRDKQRMPEPRDYRSWRDEIAKLEEGAETGTYQQFWALPDGKTFRVMGRPHPDGAIAFMFEDLSAEVSLTRQFRADLDMFQAVLDTVPAAIAVFSSDGVMVCANDAYGALWGVDPNSLPAMPRLSEATRLWAGRCEDSTIWNDIKAFITNTTDRSPSTHEIRTKDGAHLTVRLVPARGRATVVQFLPIDLPMTQPLDTGSSDESLRPATPLLDAARAAGSKKTAASA